ATSVPHGPHTPAERRAVAARMTGCSQDHPPSPSRSLRRPTTRRRRRCIVVPTVYEGRTIMQTAADRPTTPTVGSPAAVLRWAPLTGIATVVFFAVSVIASSPPGTGASDTAWTAAYTGSHDAGHIATGVCLVLSGLM